MNFKKITTGIAATTLFFGAAVVPTFAAPSVHTNFGKQLNGSQCDSTGKPVLNITYNEFNDPDSGVTVLQWATDTYNKKVKVWQQTDGTFCAIVKYQGQFITNGAGSPETGASVSAGIRGTFEGGYQANFDGDFTPGINKTDGNIGSIDYNSGYDWLSAYFTGDTFFNEPYWAWNYHAGNNGSWVNASTGNQGDITGN